MVMAGDLKHDGSTAAWPNTTYAWYVVAILTVAYSFAIVDRVALGLLVQPIEHDLGIGDAQMGLLQGLAFEHLLFNARCADRHFG